jgi:glucose/mannose-6-phosphate isomerase
MGGSGWPALYMKTWAGLKVPFEIVNDYNLPDFVGPNTLFIASSYSGNTEETLAALRRGRKTRRANCGNDCRR